MVLCAPHRPFTAVRSGCLAALFRVSFIVWASETLTFTFTCMLMNSQQKNTDKVAGIAERQGGIYRPSCGLILPVAVFTLADIKKTLRASRFEVTHSSALQYEEGFLVRFSVAA